MAANLASGARPGRAGDIVAQLYDRVAILEETDSFLIAVTEDPLTVGKEWVQASGMLLGPQGFQTDMPDLTLNEDGDTILTVREGKYFLQSNFLFVSSTADGWFEGAVEGHAPDAELWPTDITKGHRGIWVPTAALGWDDAEFGFDSTVVWPCPDDDEVTTSARFITADGLGTISVHVILYVTRLGI